VARGAAVHPRAGTTRRRGSGWERRRILRGRKGQGDPGRQRAGPGQGLGRVGPGQHDTGDPAGAEVVVLDRDLLEARRPRPEEGRIEARRPRDPEPLLVLADPAALPVEDGGVLLLDADQIEAAPDEGGWRVPRGAPTARVHGQRVLDGYEVFHRHGPLGQPAGHELGRLADQLGARIGDIALLDERGGQPRDRGEGWPRTASQGLPQVPLEERVGHRPEETGPLIPDRLWEPEHVRESVRRRTAIPGLEARRAEPRKARGIGPDVNDAHGGVAPGDASTAMRQASNGMSRPDSRRKREGGRKATSPQSRRIRATEKTSW
jgi:hypothetical protein